MESIIELLEGWGGWVAAAIVSIFAIRGSIKFDVNQWLKDRREVQREKARMLCPHAEVFLDNQGEPCFKSLFQSPSGTPNWICEQCGQTVYSEGSVIEKLRYWTKNAQGFIQQKKRFDKASKKLI